MPQPSETQPPINMQKLLNFNSKPVGIRTSEPVLRSYFDHAATSPLRSQAQDAFVSAAEIVGNPSALHASGRRARAALEDAREEIAALVGAMPDELVLTSGGSEADSIAVLNGSRASARPGVAISAIEHPAVANVRDALAPVQVLGVDRNGVVDLAELVLSDDVGLVSVMMINNEVGSVQPVVELAERARSAGALFHTDAVQALGHLPIDFDAGNADLMSVSAHKIGGPVGVGALLVKRGVTLRPYGLGGRQEGGIRSGTMLTALASGFAAALRETVAEQQAAEQRYTTFREQIVAAVADLGVRVNAQGSPAILNLGVDGASGEDLLFLLDQAGIDVSTGSACRAGVHGPSEILLAMGQSTEEASSAIRISMGWTTTADDVVKLSDVLPDVIRRARLVPSSH